VLDARYRIQHRLAHGGMSTVYLGTDTKLRRQVAIKVLFPHLASDPSFVKRFESEAISAARLSHPHVVSVYDQGVDGDTAYLVLELVPGATLRDVMTTQGRLSPRAAIEVLDAILDGLGAAHAAGLVHRDIKPENVLLAPDGRIKVADFGLSRAASKHTATGALMGTVAYVSPELVKGRPADTRADLYAVGVLFYELLTGVQPFTGDSTWQVAMAHVDSDVPRASESVPGLSPELDDLILWCTEQDPEDRPNDAAALLEELRHVRSQLREEQLDLGEEPTTFASLVASTLAVLRRKAAEPSAPRDAAPAASEAPTAAFGEAPFDRVPSPGAPPDGPAPTQADVGSPAARTAAAPDEGRTTPLPATAAATTPLVGGMGSAATAALPEQQSGDSPRGGEPPAALVLPRLPRAEQDAQLEVTGPVPPRSSKRAARAEAKSLAKAAQTPTQSLERPGTRRRAWIWVTIVVLAAAIVGTGAWFFGAGPGARVLIPELRGSTAAAATATLGQEGVGVTSREVFDEELDAGLVVSTDPGAGSHVMRMNSVRLSVSKGPRLYAVPNVVGLDRAAAGSQLEAASLSLGKVTEDWNESVAKGLVVSQKPKVGAQLRSGAAVGVVVSKGPAPVAVPELSGYLPDDAEALLSAKGLTPERGEDVFSEEIPEGQVATQSTPGDETIAKGSTVRYSVSKGPELVDVPGVFNKSTDEATKILESAGFEVDVKQGGVFGTVFDRVVGQDPSKGKARKGSTVTITVY